MDCSCGYAKRGADHHTPLSSCQDCISADGRDDEVKSSCRLRMDLLDELVCHPPRRVFPGIDALTNGIMATVSMARYGPSSSPGACGAPLRGFGLDRSVRPSRLVGHATDAHS